MGKFPFLYMCICGEYSAIYVFLFTGYLNTILIFAVLLKHFLC